MQHSGHRSTKIPPAPSGLGCNPALQSGLLHCRAAAGSGPYADELTTAEGKKLLDDLATLGQVVVILTGGEPLLRDDIFDLAAYGHGLGHRMVMAVNGTLLTPAIALRLKAAGIQRLSISIDGATAGSHDRLRAVEGAYAGALNGIAAWRGRAPLSDQHHRTRANRLNSRPSMNWP